MATVLHATFPSLDQAMQAGGGVVIGQCVKIKALDPVTSTCPPSLAEVTEYSSQAIMLRVGRYMTLGTLVQIQLEGAFSLWKVFCCVRSGSNFHLGLELANPLA